MGQRARIFISETQWLPEVKCLATGLVLSWFMTDLQCSPNLILNDLFIRQCRHEIDQLPKFRPRRPSNLTPLEFEALKSLRGRIDIVIKPADKGGALVVWKTDLYRNEAHRQLNDTSFYRRVDEDMTSHHQSIVRTTVHNLISNGGLPQTSLNLLTTTPRTPVIYFFLKSTNLTTQGDLLCLLVVVLPNTFPASLTMLWHHWLGIYHPISRTPNMLSKSSNTLTFNHPTNSFSPWMSNPYTLSFRIRMV